MPSIVRLRQTNPAAGSATEMPSKTHRDFCPRQKGRQISFHESNRESDSTKSPYPRFLPRGCFLADLPPQSSANKEQRPTISESKNFRNKAAQMVCKHLFQKEIYAAEVDYAVTIAQGVHPKDPADFGASLQQREVGQCRTSKFC